MSGNSSHWNHIPLGAVINRSNLRHRDGNESEIIIMQNLEVDIARSLGSKMDDLYYEPPEYMSRVRTQGYRP